MTSLPGRATLALVAPATDTAAGPDGLGSDLPTRDAVRRAGMGQLLQVLVSDEAAAAYGRIGSLRRLLAGAASVSDLVTAVRLTALREILARLVTEPRPRGAQMVGPIAVGRLMADLALLDHEEFHVIYLDVKHTVITTERVGVGTTTSVETHPAEIFRPAIDYRATAVILVHNHPSGDPSPSENDRVLTSRITRIGHELGVPVLDHVIIGAARQAYAFSDQRIFWL